MTQPASNYPQTSTSAAYNVPVPASQQQQYSNAGYPLPQAHPQQPAQYIQDQVSANCVFILICSDLRVSTANAPASCASHSAAGTSQRLQLPRFSFTNS